MKLILFILLSSVSIISAHLGKSFFPVMIQVVEEKSGTPIAGAKVRLTKLPDYNETELDPEKINRLIPASLGKEVVTNELGIAVVFYAGKWTYNKNKHSRSFLGTITVNYNNTEVYSKSLKKWAQENQITSDFNQAPMIVILLDEEGKFVPER